MNSVVSFLSSFVFSLHLVMNPWRLRGIVQVSFCFIFVCVAGLFTISKGVFSPSWGIRIEEGEEENKKGRYFSILKTGGGLTIREAALVFVFLLQEANGMDGTSFHQIRVLQNSSVSCLGESCFGKWSVRQIRRRLVQFLTPSPPCFLKGFLKRALCFLFKESYTEIHLRGI